MQSELNLLAKEMDGVLYYDATPEHNTQLLAYSTDASVYQEKPLAVAMPANVGDIRLLIDFAAKQRVTLIPRAAGTSLAGQVVGSGVVVDISKHFNNIKEINVEEKWVKVEPGVIRDDLNLSLRPYGLMFGPETSTANRAMIGGMVGNNSCGLHSMVWGSVREHLLEVTALLSDGSEVIFMEEQPGDPKHTGLKKTIYDGVLHLMNDPANQQLVRDQFPDTAVVRRNTGYALDSLIRMAPFTPSGDPFNLCKLIAGSEGTLAFITEVKLALIDLPPKEIALVCIHCNSLQEALQANIAALRHKPMASELVDRYILNFTLAHPEYGKNASFIEGDPAAILMVEFMDDDQNTVSSRALQLISDLKDQHFGYAYPLLFNQDTKMAWDVRKAGLGLLRNLPGDIQPVNLIEDCAVAPGNLPAYVSELQALLAKYEVNASYYAHAGAGELHVEPMINLKSAEGLVLFRKILEETVVIVKKYRGSLSGEHGDGRLRGEFIPAIVGEEGYNLFKQIKQLFDPHDIFNRGKITGTPPMDTSLRVAVNSQPSPLDTTFDFSMHGSMLRLAEKCSGSGDCRRSHLAGGTMCPSYMATRNEKDTTRARANVLRQFLDNPDDKQPLRHEEIKEVMDLCISCKGCKSECPSGLDITKMKAEFLQQYYDVHGIPLRSRMIGNFAAQMKMASKFPWAYNLIFKNKTLRSAANRVVGFHPDRSMPLLANTTLQAWYRRRKLANNGMGKKVYFFCDEFTNYLDVEIGKKAIRLLEALGYQVFIPDHIESGRSFLSKGLVKEAARIANRNIIFLSDLVTADAPLVGIEPSTILTFRDEYLDLASRENKQKSHALANHSFTIEEFIAREAGGGHISPDLFTTEKRTVALHGHCYQKVLSSQHHSSAMLSLPPNYVVQVIPSGCCGMAGSFGYEVEHYEVSQQIGELVLFPTVRSLSEEVLIAASGTSCRHQIKDGTQRAALHPVEILWGALSQNRQQ